MEEFVDLKKKSRFSLGFTLVEVLVVITMIGALASIVMVRVGTAKKQGEDTAVATSLNLGNCWCIDYQGVSKKVILQAGEECDDKLVTTTCP